MFMDKRSVTEIIMSCVDKLHNKDKYLFDCKACERCLMFRFAYYLQIKFSNYYVDCEFNKMGFNNYKHETKVETIDQGKILKKMYADIIVHKRNSNIQNNFICLEIKKIRRKMNYDLERLKNMTRINGFRYNNINYIYAYDYGFFIYLPKDKRKFEIRIFENGEESQLE